MSFILDALKKSEAERQRQAGPALIEMRIVRPTRRLPAWAIIAGTLLVVGVLALAWVALRKPAPAAAGVPATAFTASAPGAVNAAGGAEGATGASAATGVAAAGGVAGSAAPVGGGSVVTMQDASPTLAAPAAITRPAAAAPADDNPADEAPAEAPVANAGSMGGHVDTRALRNYAELGGSMPELRLDLHVYAAKPEERYAFINMHKLREGDSTPEGVLVKAITPEGVVLEYRGTEFLLGH